MMQEKHKCEEMAQKMFLKWCVIYTPFHEMTLGTKISQFN